MEFDNIIRSIFYDKENIDLKNISSFYLNKDAIGLVFQGNKFTYPLEFNLKTRQIQ